MLERLGLCTAMPYAANDGIRIHYQVEGSGPPLVLLHGLCDSSKMWYDLGYVDRLKGNYTLVLMDARGHGKSDQPQETDAYKLELMATDVLTVLDDLKIEKAHFLGFSLGGWICFGVAQKAPKRVDSLIVVAMHPYTTDLDAPAAANPLHKMAIPCLLLVGESDPFYSKAKEFAEHADNVTFIPFPLLGHFELISRSQLTLPYIRRFLETRAAMKH